MPSPVDQLCIIYANECLQHAFMKCFLAYETQLLGDECILDLAVPVCPSWTLPDCPWDLGGGLRLGDLGVHHYQ